VQEHYPIDTDTLARTCKEVLQEYPKEAKLYQDGHIGLIAFLMAQTTNKLKTNSFNHEDARKIFQEIVGGN
jgi:Asp-tRNA(Asn)/Glu-tRNA(Gln) amidotransferase B subunit